MVKGPRRGPRTERYVMVRFVGGPQDGVERAMRYPPPDLIQVTLDGHARTPTKGGSVIASQLDFAIGRYTLQPAEGDVVEIAREMLVRGGTPAVRDALGDCARTLYQWEGTA